MKLSLKHISQEEKQELLTNVFLFQTSDYLNNVNLRTAEGKKKYIDDVIMGKNPFKKEENPEDLKANFANINLHTSTTWSDIIRLAGSCFDIEIKPDINNMLNPFSDKLLNLAFNKKVNEIAREIFEDKEHIAKKIIEAYQNNISNYTSLSSAIKIIKNISTEIFTECERCGYDNQAAWIFCQQCGFENII